MWRIGESWAETGGPKSACFRVVRRSVRHQDSEQQSNDRYHHRLLGQSGCVLPRLIPHGFPRVVKSMQSMNMSLCTVSPPLDRTLRKKICFFADDCVISVDEREQLISHFGVFAK